MMLKNLTPATVLLIGTLSLSVGWLAGKSTNTDHSPQGAPASPARSGTRPLVGADDVAPFTGQLRKRIGEQPSRAPATGRNPFVFGRRPSAGAALREDATTAALPVEPVPFAPPPPRIKLSGIASNREGDATVLTAIVNDNGALAFVKAGDKLPSGATVITVDETGVVIRDAAGITQTLRLP